MNRSSSLLLAAVASIALVLWIGLLRNSADTSGLTTHQLRSLQSLEKVSDHPLYVMRYYAPTDSDISPAVSVERTEKSKWACSLFAAVGDGSEPVYGRNLDWPRHPVLVLIAEPPDAYASITMVDLSFILPIEFTHTLDQLPIAERAFLLQTPQWTFDGMNDQGVAIGMAAVADSVVPSDPALETVGSLQIMRRVLDRAASVEEALEILEQVNVDMQGGPCVHYLIADKDDHAVLVEYWDGEMTVLHADEPWLWATNYHLCRVEESDRPGLCWRYDLIGERLRDSSGILTRRDAMSLLESVSWQSSDGSSHGTQWSIVYDMKARSASLVMGRKYDEVITFDLFGSN